MPTMLQKIEENSLNTFSLHKPKWVETEQFWGEISQYLE